MISDIETTDLRERALAVITKRHLDSTRAIGGNAVEGDGYIFSNTGSPNAWDNGVVITKQPSDNSFAEIIAEAFKEFGNAGFVVVSPWDVEGFEHDAIKRQGHPPFMAALSKLELLAPEGFHVRSVSDSDDIDVFQQTAQTGFEGKDKIKIVDVCTIGNPFNLFVGYIDGEPVTTAASVVKDEAVLIEIVATIPSARGNGYGAAITTYAANVAHHAIPVLMSSEKGRSVYEGIGFQTVEHWTIWSSKAPVDNSTGANHN